MQDLHIQNFFRNKSYLVEQEKSWIVMRKSKSSPIPIQKMANLTNLSFGGKKKRKEERTACTEGKPGPNMGQVLSYP